MTIKTATALATEADANVTQNTVKSNTGTNVNALFNNLIDSTWGVEYMVAITDADSPYTVDLDIANVLICDDTSGAITLNLPAAASNTHRTLYVKKISASNSVTLDGSGAETIDNAATLTLSTQYNYVRIVSDGSEWWVISLT